MFHGTQFPTETFYFFNFIFTEKAACSTEHSFLLKHNIMERKKWTAKKTVTESYQKFKDKRKWQLGLRRYILERNPSQFYAPYFGLGIEDFRNWIEIQFTEDLTWENFGSTWQFDHIVPISYFDFDVEEDLKLGWNFINIAVQSTATEGRKVDILAVKPYFERLHEKTGYDRCLRMVEKISSIQLANMVNVPAVEAFIVSNKEKIEELKSFDASDFYNLNKGTSFDDILTEKAIFKKFS